MKKPRPIRTKRGYLKAIKDRRDLNPLEDRFAQGLLDLGHPFFYQYRFDLPAGWMISGRKYFVIDFFLSAFNIAIETDGKIHREDLELAERDRLKNNTLTSFGMRVFRFTYDEVFEKTGAWNIYVMLQNLTHRLPVAGT